MHVLPLTVGALLILLPAAHAADQTRLGEGNAEAARLASSSPLVATSRRFIEQRISSICNDSLRTATRQALNNSSTCIAHRVGLTDSDKDAIVQELIAAGLLNATSAENFPGGGRSGIFPPVPDDGTPCPRLPQRFYAAPGSGANGHHTYPGGLVVHEAFNSLSYQSFADNYRRVFGRSGPDGSAELDGLRSHPEVINEDIITAAPLWHDWAKAIVFQWNADGTEFAELRVANTGSHHVLGVAETMKREFAPDFVIAQASAHTNPTDDEAKVVGFLRAAAIIARVDPVARGYLRNDGQSFRLAATRKLGDIELNGAGRINFLVEYGLHNLSDADWVIAEPAVDLSELVLAELAPAFGYDPKGGSYIVKFRNPALSHLSAERIAMFYGNGGLAAVKAELTRLRKRGVI